MEANKTETNKALTDYFDNRFMDLAKHNQHPVSDTEKEKVYTDTYNDVMNECFQFLTKKYQKEKGLQNIANVDIEDAMKYIYLPMLKMQIMKNDDMWIEDANINWSFNGPNLQIMLGNHPEKINGLNNLTNPTDDKSKNSNQDNHDNADDKGQKDDDNGK